MHQREKGVASHPCPTCEAERQAVTQPDGSTAYENCSTCFPESTDNPKVETAQVAPAAPQPKAATSSAPQTSMPRETGTDTQEG